jgi:hypothetical protein
MNWTDLTEGRDQIGAVFRKVINLRIEYNFGIFLII